MGQLPSSAFQLYNPSNAGTIQAGPFSLFQVTANTLGATQLNVGFFEVDKKIDGFDELTSQAAVSANLLTAIEPVVIGPGGKLYLTDGHHTLLALTDSGWGSANPLVDVNVIANFSNLTPQQFFTTLEQDNLVFPVNDGVLQSVDTTTGAPLPSSLTGLTSDPYRGLEYAILKDKSSKLFTTTSNITGAVGPAIPGLDKTAAFYSDFIWADAYRSANNGLGLPYLSPTDILIATNWNLNGANQTTLPNIGTVTVSQLPGYILPSGGNIVITGTVSNATLINGTLDGSKTGTFDETTTFASFNGLRGLNLGPVTIGSSAPGFIIQLGNDLGGTVTLSGSNTYTGGTTILAGTLIITGDASLGAAALANPISLSGIAASVEADNGIIFNSLTEGNGTLQIGATATPGVNSFTTNRPIAVDGEVANINLNGNTLTLTGPIVSLGAISTGISNATGEADFTVEDNSSKGNGVLVLAPSSGGNPNFYGNWIVSSGTLQVSSDASLGNTSGPSYEIGQIELNGGTFQAGANFSSVRSLFLAGGSTYDTNGFTNSFTGNMQDVQRTLAVINSSTTNAGAVSFGTFEVSATATLNVSGGTAGNSITFTNGIIRDPASTLILQPTSGIFGTTEKVFDTSTGPNATNTVINGIVAPWIVVYDATPSNTLPNSPYSFATYSSTSGFTATAGNSTNILTATGTSTVQQSTSITGTTVANNLQAYALSVQNGTGIALNGHTLTLGDGSNPVGLILDGGASISNGALATGGSELVVWLAGKSTNANTISAQITGSGGLTIAGGLQATNLGLSGSNANGSGTLNINTATAETGPVTIDSGVVALNVVNALFSSISGVMLENTKKSPSPAILNITQSNVFTALQSAGSNSTINLSNGAVLTIGDTTNNLSSTLSSNIAETGTGVTGALTKNGSSLLDISGSGGVSFASGSTVNVNGGALRIANGVFGASATTVIAVATGAELQYAGNGGSKFNDPIQGGGILHLLAGTVQLTSTSNTYKGGTVLEVGTTLDVTTANLPTNGAVINAGGTLDFDQTTTGTFSGVMSDGEQAGGASDPDALAALASGPALPGTLIKDDSSGANSGNVTIGAVQAYTGATYIEAGTLTLGVTNAIASSSGVVLGRVGGGATATLALNANNTVSALSTDASNTTNVQLNGHVLTLATASNSVSALAGNTMITDGTLSSSGIVDVTGGGTTTLDGVSVTNGTATSTGSLALDGNAFSNQSYVSSANVTLTTAHANDVIILDIVQNGSTGSTVSDAAGLIWNQRAVAGGARQTITEYYAIAPNALSGDVITVNFGGTDYYADLNAFGISGANTSSPFDANVSVPATAGASTAAVTTSNPNDFIFAGYRFIYTPGPGAGSGWTAISAGGGYYMSEYQVTSATQSGLVATTSSADLNGGIVDAVVQASGAPAALTVDAGSTLDLHNTTIAGGTLGNSGTVDLTGTSALNGVVVTNSGLLEVTSGTLTVDPSTVTNTGTLEATTGGTLDLDGISVTNTSANVTVNAGSTLDFDITTIAGGTLTNAGTVDLTGTSALTGVAMTNSGLLEATGGTLTVDPSTVTNTGTLEATTGGTLDLDGISITNTSGSVTVDAGSTLDLDGTTITGGTLTNAGTVDSTGTSALTGVAVTNSGLLETTTGTLTVDPSTVTNTGTLEATTGGTLDLDAISVTNTGGSVTVNAGSTLDLQSTTITGGTLSNSGTVDLTGTSALTGVAVTNSGLLEATSGTLTVDPSTVTNTGTLEATTGGTLNLDGIIVTNTSGNVTVDEGSMLDLHNTTITGGTLSNSATVDVTGGGTSTLDGVRVTNGAVAGTSSLALDGNAFSNQSYVSSANVTLTTAHANDVIILDIIQNGSTGSTVSDAAGLTWNVRAVAGGARQTIAEYYAVAPNALSGDVITVNFGGTDYYADLNAFGISGANTSSPFDTNVSVPATAGVSTAAVTTSNPNDFIFAGYRFIYTPGPGAGSGWTAISAGGGYYMSEYQVTSAVQSGLVATTSSADLNGGIADAVVQASGAPAAMTVDAGSTLDLNNTTIAGGTLGNAGTVNSTGTSALNGVVVTNSGLLEATGGILTISGSVTNTGNLLANGASLDITGPVTGNGTATISGTNAVLEFGAASAENSTFATGATGMFKLDAAQSLTGTVAGLANGDSIDLANFLFSGNPTIDSVTGTGNSGTTTNVTVKDGSLSATLQLFNQYANQFAVNSAAYSLTADNNTPNHGTLFQLAAAH